MDTKYNANHPKGWAFNETPHRAFYEITPEEIMAERKRRFDLMNKTRESLGPMSQTDQQD